MAVLRRGARGPGRHPTPRKEEQDVRGTADAILRLRPC